MKLIDTTKIIYNQSLSNIVKKIEFSKDIPFVKLQKEYERISNFMYDCVKHNDPNFLKIKKKSNKNYSNRARLLIYINYRIDSYLGLSYFTFNCYDDLQIGEATNYKSGGYKYGEKIFLVDENKLLTNKAINLYEINKDMMRFKFRDMIKDLNIKVEEKDIIMMEDKIIKNKPFWFINNTEDDILINHIVYDKDNDNNIINNKIRVIFRKTNITYMFGIDEISNSNRFLLYSNNGIKNKTLNIPKWVSNRVDINKSNYWF